MQLHSSVFAQEGIIPSKYTWDGDNVSPPLSWDAPPNGTSSFVLIVENPDAPRGTFTHWIVYDIPANQGQLLEGISNESALPDGSKQGKNDFGQLGFGGPSPSNGSYRYFFKLYALDRSLNLDPGASKAEVLDAMKDHVLEFVELIGHYAQ
jgi:hypothetical protein